MERMIECGRCRQLLPAHEFEVNWRSRRTGIVECKVCRHRRLARRHSRAEAALLADRRRRRGNEQERVEAARAAAGRD